MTHNFKVGDIIRPRRAMYPDWDTMRYQVISVNDSKRIVLTCLDIANHVPATYMARDFEKPVSSFLVSHTKEKKLNGSA